MPLAIHPAAPDSRGQFGPYGGRYMPETLVPALDELERQFKAALADEDFWQTYRGLLADYVGRPSPLFLARGVSGELGGAQVYLKREDLNHTGAHKINNCLGQILLARRMGKRRIIAETGAGQHGVATATVCALFGLQCVVYMGAEDMERQSVNVRRMRMLGAEVRAVHAGTATLKDAMNEALRDWIAHPADTYYLLGTGAGPHPYPWLVREFQKVIGEETRQQIAAKTGRVPDAMVACVGGGSNAMGFFYPFLELADVRLYGVEAGGLGLASGAHAASISAGHEGVLHGCRSYYLQDEDGQIVNAHSISAGLDYPGVGPEHAWLSDTGRASYIPATDDEAMQALRLLSETEGIIPAIESAHALAGAIRLGRELGPDAVIAVCLSGRGDKDMDTAAQYFGLYDEEDAS
jgi:tryptophan synthase beta chain